MRLSFVHAAILGLALAEEPCGKIASIVKQYDGAIDAQLALECLQSVPVDTKGDLSLLDGLLSFSNFQSTLAYLKDPPAGYPYPAVDVLGEFQNIKSKLQKNGYSSEYEIQNDIYNVFTSVHDGHFIYIPDILNVFTWTRTVPVFSISSDGVSVPQTYAGPDVPVLGGVVKAGYTPSPVEKINGQNAETFLQALANDTSINDHDPDAAYNNVFPILPLIFTNNGGEPLFTLTTQYPGTDTVLTFKNGSNLHVQTFAQTGADWTGVTDGQTFFNTFCRGYIPYPSGSASASSAAASSTAAASSANTALHKRVTSSSSAASSAAASASGSAIPSLPVQSTQVSYAPVPSQTLYSGPQAFPKPWVIANDLSIACYFPEENTDLAVLAVPNFGPASTTDFSDVIRECLATSNKLGKKKLAIDLRGNGGGTVYCAYDFFKQLFPSMTPWGTSNFRAWKLFDQVGKAVTSKYADTTYLGAGRQGYHDDFGSIFNGKQEDNPALKAYSSWDAFYGPEYVHDDTFTNLVRLNLTSRYVVGKEKVSGYGNLTNIVPKQTFAAEDIVLLQDGQCASTCTVFTEFMKEQAHVGQIAFGGRAQTGPMQGVGGTKGANDYAYNYLLQLVRSAGSLVSASQRKAYVQEWGTAIEGAYQVDVRSVKGSEGPEVHVNFRNNIRKGDTTLTPLQFVYEAANCRLFYTAEQAHNQALVWKAAYASYWGGSKCVSGSTGQLSSKPGLSYILASPGAKSAPPTPKSDVASATSSGAAMPLYTGAMAAMVPAFAAGAMLL